MSVPKIIHQFWIGDNPPTKAMDTIKNMNPDIEYMFWDEEKCKSNLPIKHKYQLKIDLMKELNGKCDMYRWYILKKYGGLFIDADILCLEKIDDFMFNQAFFCWENEKMRPNLCATTIMAFPPEHNIPTMAIEYILNFRITGAAWQSVGPELLTKVYNSCKENKNTNVNVLPSYVFLPDHLTGVKYNGHSKVYTTHLWGSTFKQYANLNTEIPKHHLKPDTDIRIHIPTECNIKKIKEIINGIKNMEGHFNIIIDYYGKIDITRFLISTRFVSWCNITRDIENLKRNIIANVEVEEELIFYDDNDRIIDHHNVENIEQRLAKKFVKPEDIVLELGARYGSVSCVTNKIINTEGNKDNHYVVEPDSSVWKALEDNMNINNCKFNIIKGIIGKKPFKLSGNGYAVSSDICKNNNDAGYNNNIYDIPNVPFNTLIADCEGYMETFYNENKEWFKTINKIILECDMPHKCNYEYVTKSLLDLGFKIEHTEKDSWGLVFIVFIK
mgnify:CR=1 FL=1